MNIENLLKLDRLRDLRQGVEYSEYNKITNYGYVEYPGIIDELFRGMYKMHELYCKNEDTDETELCPARLEMINDKRQPILGHYAERKRLSKEDINHPFHNLFIGVETVVKKAIYGDDHSERGYERHFSEDWDQEARLMLLEELIALSENKSSKFKVENIDDFKNILIDKELAEHVKAYIFRSIKNKVMKRCLNEGSRVSYNKDFYYKRETVDGVRKMKRVYNNFLELDKSNEFDEDTSPYDILDFNQENPQEELFKIKNEGNLFKYILDNRNVIFTNKQLNYLDFILAGGDRAKYKEDYSFSCKRTEENIVKKALEKLEDNKYFYIENSQLRQKQMDFLETVEQIINAENELEQFFLIQSVLYSDTVINKIFIDLIYGLDERIIRDLVFCIEDRVDENWIQSKGFKKIIEVLIKEYNFQIKNAKLIYNYNVNKKISKEEKLINYIEKNVFFIDQQEFGLIAKRKNDVDIPTIEDIKEFINRLFGINIEKTEVKFVLDKYNYVLNTSKKTTKNKIGCYKVFRKHS